LVSRRESSWWWVMVMIGINDFGSSHFWRQRAIFRITRVESAFESDDRSDFCKKRECEVKSRGLVKISKPILVGEDTKGLASWAEQTTRQQRSCKTNTRARRSGILCRIEAIFS
jgi:hypothetical protein